MDDCVVELDVIPGELAQLARAKAEGDRQHEQRFEPAVYFRVFVEAEFRAAEAAGGRGEVGADLGDGSAQAGPGAACQLVWSSC